MKLKKCKKCECDKPRDEFYKLVSPKYKPEWDCRDSYCIPCRLAYGNKRRKDIKQQAVEYLGGKCEECGLVSEYYVIYDFHHRDPSQKDFSIGKNTKAFNTIKSELDKCSLLCAHCHRIKHYKKYLVPLKSGARLHAP